MYTMRRGGAYDRFRMMLDALLERGCKVHCLSLTPIPINDLGYQNHIAVLPSFLKGPSIAKILVFILFPFYALRIGRRERIDRFVAFGPLYAFLQAIAKWILKKPMITFIRLDLSFNSKKSSFATYARCLDEVIESIGLISSDRILTTNTETQERIKQLVNKRKATRVEVLFNNIPPQLNFMGEKRSIVCKQFQIPKEASIIVTAGVITPRKNFDFILRCVSQIERNDLYLLVVGDNSFQRDIRYKDYLTNLTKTLGLNKRVIFTGWVKQEELWKIFHGTDLFVLPSKIEGMPNVMLEALGCGLPCLGSNIPGIRDILQYDELLFDPIDQKALADKIRKLFSDSKALDEIERLCRERKEAFLFDWKEKVFQAVTQGFQAT
jgi:glycosyltransferase involved in cell wall biosynthesis